MTSEQISAIVNVFCCVKDITPLQKDIVDTWNVLQKNPFDETEAKKQIASNIGKHPDVALAVNAKPTTIQKRADEITQTDLIYILWSQLEFLIVKEAGKQNR